MNIVKSTINRYRMRLFVVLNVVALSLVLAVPAFADLGTQAASAATGGVTDAVVVAGIIVAFAVGYRLIRKVTG